MTKFYFSPDGSDKQSGTQTAPKKTLAAAGQVAKPGDAVYFRGGQAFPGQLQPAVGGAAGKPVTYGMWGSAKPYIAGGVWSHVPYVALRNLVCGAQIQAGAEGATPADDIFADGWALTNVHIYAPAGNQKLGLALVGDGCTVTGGSIHGSGLSAIYAVGDSHVYSGIVIDTYGQYQSGYNPHGLYLKVSNPTVKGCTIGAGPSAAISLRYHGGTVTGNTAAGAIGVHFGSYDTVAGMTTITGNTFVSTDAGIFTVADTEPLIESFTIPEGSNLFVPSLANGWQAMNLGDTTGQYVLASLYERLSEALVVRKMGDAS